MKFTLTNSTVTVEREPGDPGLHRGGYTPDGWSLESVALGWVMRWLAKEHGVRLVRTTVGRDYTKRLSCHMTDDKLPLLRQPVNKYGKGGLWDVFICNADYAVQSVEHNWGGWQWVNGDPKGAKGPPRPLVFRIFKASDDATPGEEP